jgi:hypothetical protein
VAQFHLWLEASRLQRSRPFVTGYDWIQLSQSVSRFGTFVALERSCGWKLRRPVSTSAVKSDTVHVPCTGCALVALATFHLSLPCERILAVNESVDI